MNSVKTAVLRVLLNLMFVVAVPTVVLAGGEVKVEPSADKSKAVISLSELDVQKVTLSK